MEEPLWPTPTSNQPGGSAEQHLERKRRMPGGPRNSVTDLRMKLDQLSSASSPASEDSTLPSKPSDGSASDRSSGTPTAPPSSNDTGRLFPDSGTYEKSPEKRSWPPLDPKFDLAAHLYEQGWSVGAIAARYGVTRQSMWKTLQRRTALRSRDDAAALTRKPPNAVRKKRATTQARYRKRAARITVAQMRKVRARDVVCQMCGAEGTDFDHKWPVALGGQTTLENLQLLCHPCHIEKSRRDRSLAAAARRGEVVPTEASWISSQGASRSPVSPSATPASARPRPTTAGSGRSSPAALMSFDPDGSLSRMSPDCSVQENLPGLPSPKWSGTWPRWGSCRDGVVYEHPTSVPRTDGSGSSSLPTPTTQDGSNTAGPSQFDRHSLPLNAAVMVLPTPRTPSGGPDATGNEKRPSGAQGTTNLAGALLELDGQT